MQGPFVLFLIFFFLFLSSWCSGGDSNPYAVMAGDFKSPVSTDSTT